MDSQQRVTRNRKGAMESVLQQSAETTPKRQVVPRRAIARNATAFVGIAEQNITLSPTAAPMPSTSTPKRQQTRASAPAKIDDPLEAQDVQWHGVPPSVRRSYPTRQVIQQQTVVTTVVTAPMIIQQTVNRSCVVTVSGKTPPVASPSKQMVTRSSARKLTPNKAAPPPSISNEGSEAHFANPETKTVSAINTNAGTSREESVQKVVKPARVQRASRNPKRPSAQDEVTPPKQIAVSRTGAGKLPPKRRAPSPALKDISSSLIDPDASKLLANTVVVPPPKRTRGAIIKTAEQGARKQNAVPAQPPQQQAASGSSSKQQAIPRRTLAQNADGSVELIGKSDPKPPTGAIIKTEERGVRKQSAVPVQPPQQQVAAGTSSKQQTIPRRTLMQNADGSVELIGKSDPKSPAMVALPQPATVATVARSSVLTKQGATNQATPPGKQMGKMQMVRKVQPVNTSPPQLTPLQKCGQQVATVATPPPLSSYSGRTVTIGQRPVQANAMRTGQTVVLCATPRQSALPTVQRPVQANSMRTGQTMVLCATPRQSALQQQALGTPRILNPGAPQNIGIRPASQLIQIPVQNSEGQIAQQQIMIRRAAQSVTVVPRAANPGMQNVIQPTPTTRYLMNAQQQVRAIQVAQQARPSSDHVASPQIPAQLQNVPTTSTSTAGQSNQTSPIILQIPNAGKPQNIIITGGRKVFQKVAAAEPTPQRTVLNSALRSPNVQNQQNELSPSERLEQQLINGILRPMCVNGQQVLIRDLGNNQAQIVAHLETRADGVMQIIPLTNTQ